MILCQEGSLDLLLGFWALLSCKTEEIPRRYREKTEERVQKDRGRSRLPDSAS